MYSVAVWFGACTSHSGVDLLWSRSSPKLTPEWFSWGGNRIWSWLYPTNRFISKFELNVSSNQVCLAFWDGAQHTHCGEPWNKWRSYLDMKRGSVKCGAALHFQNVSLKMLLVQNTGLLLVFSFLLPAISGVNILTWFAFWFALDFILCERKPNQREPASSH